MSSQLSLLQDINNENYLKPVKLKQETAKHKKSEKQHRDCDVMSVQ